MDDMNKFGAVDSSSLPLASLFEHLPVGVIVMDAGGQWLWTNAALRAFTGKVMGGRDGVLSERWRAHGPDGQPLPPSDWPGARASRGETVTPGVEFTCLTDDGQTLWARLSAAPLRDGAGAIVAIITVLEDIDDFKRREMALHSRARDLSDLNRRLDEFSHTVSHDLRSPLKKILAFGDLLANALAGTDNPDAAHYLKRVRVSALKAIELIDGILRYTREAADARSIVDVDMNEVVDDVLADLEATLKEAAADVRRETLPVIRAHPVQMRQLLSNLIGNALKYRRGDPLIRISAAREAAGWTFRVKDNCRGMAPEILDHIFDLFVRAEAPGVEGDGIGLAICRRIVEGHGGRIWARSQPEKGSTFYFTLPC